MSTFIAWVSAWFGSRPRCLCSGWPHDPVTCPRSRRYPQPPS